MSKLIKKVTTVSAAAALAATAIVPVASAQENVVETEITHVIFTTESGALASVEMGLYEQALIAEAVNPTSATHIQLGNGKVYPMEMYEQAFISTETAEEAAQLLIDNVDPVEDKVSEGTIQDGEVIIEDEQSEDRLNETLIYNFAA